jgi:hypothetical protein
MCISYYIYLPLFSRVVKAYAVLNIRVEETSDIGKLEIATEREIQRGITIEKNLSQSWEDLSLVIVFSLSLNCSQKEARIIKSTSTGTRYRY